MIRKEEKYKAIALNNFEEIPQIKKFLTEEERHNIKVVGNILPFKANNYVVDELIDWDNISADPIFRLTFPQKDMLSASHFKKVEDALSPNLNKQERRSIADHIRYQLNPNPAEQENNVPTLDGIKLPGIQHKYRETILFFPSESQTCHAYCTFCFRWSQFVGIEELKFAMKEKELLVNYVKEHPEVTDIIFTGGDPMIMSAKKLVDYIEPLISAPVGNLKNIRIGTKVLGYWPYKFLTDKDADDIIRLFERVVNKGYHLTLMAHFTHPNELKTDAVKKAIKRILSTGVQIRTQSPLMRYINDSSEIWEKMWSEQVNLGCIPYYMFIARDTGAQNYFAVPLERALEIYNNAYQRVSGLVKTVKGPSMSTSFGKIELLGINELNGEKVFTLRFIQRKKGKRTKEVFFARYNPTAIWLTDLEPAFNEEKFFFEEDVYEYEIPTIHESSPYL